MKTLKKILSLQEKVEVLLTDYPELKDDDKLLVTQIWDYELKKLEIDPKTTTVDGFFKLYQNNFLPIADVITRARRKVQELNPELRGLTWNERHKEGEDIRKTI
jgi:hypothetical protein